MSNEQVDQADGSPVKLHHICDDMCYSMVTHDHPEYAICDTAQERDRDIFGPDDEFEDEFCEEGED